MEAATQHSAPPRRNRTWKGPRTLPATLPDDTRYVLWRYGSTPNGKGKYPKIPYNPHKQYTDKRPDGTYKGGATDDDTTWGTFDQCMAAAADWRGWFDGVGIVILPGEVFIDLDDGVDPAHANQLLDASRGRAYQEQSVSGSGDHIIVLGHTARAIKTDTIEIYEGGDGRGRYCALGTELDGSTAPGAAQDVIDQAISLSGVQPRSSGPRASLRLVETVAMTAELAADIHEAANRLPDLLCELRGNMTGQLADLLYRGTFPPALKDTSASGARAVIVAQLQRAPKRRYTDAEVYTLARELWRRKGHEGAMQGNDRALDRDAWRLIAHYRPGAPTKPSAAKRPYQEAPDPLVYLARLADEAAGDAVPLNRDERAAIVGCTRATAQRTEEKLVKADLIELKTYALHGGLRGRRGAIRITPAGFAALHRANESVIQSETAAPAANDQVTPSAPARAKPTIEPDKYTFVGDRGQPPAHHTQPRVPPASEPAKPWTCSVVDAEPPDPFWDGIDAELAAWEQTTEGQRAQRWEARQAAPRTGLTLAQRADMRARGQALAEALGLGPPGGSAGRGVPPIPDLPQTRSKPGPDPAPFDPAGLADRLRAVNIMTLNTAQVQGYDNE